jgi:lipopolysaccharide biosynthesis regulator YciM
VELLQALTDTEHALGTEASQQLPRLLAHLRQHPNLTAAQMLLAIPRTEWTDEAWAALRDSVARAARPLQRHRCVACGFEAQHYFWQCPGCLSWDSYPTQRLDAQ